MELFSQASDFESQVVCCNDFSGLVRMIEIKGLELLRFGLSLECKYDSCLLKNLKAKICILLDIARVDQTQIELSIAALLNRFGLAC